MARARSRTPTRTATILAALVAGVALAAVAALAAPARSAAQLRAGPVGGHAAQIRIGPAAARTTAPKPGSLLGVATAPRVAGAAATAAVADLQVTATAANGTRYTTATASNGWYDLEQLPAGAYSVSAALPGGAQVTTKATVRAGARATAAIHLTDPVATITGAVRGTHDGSLAGIPVMLTAAGAGNCAMAPACGTAVASGANGGYTMHVPAGTYSLQVSDAGQAVAAQTVDAQAGATAHVRVALPAAPVPAKTTPHHTARDLRWLNAERVADGLPAGLTLSRRWSRECAAHDAYEQLNHVLTPSENPDSPGASIGGGWAGHNSDLAEGHWQHGSDPWEDAPIHLLALLAPSLQVVGIDDSGGYQCVTTYPGLVRPATTTDRISTYPAAGARHVPPAERALESPFVPGQFVGIPSGHTAGRELFVYLNLAHRIGQAPVHVLSARLTTGGHAVAVRHVDSTTPTVGRYLAGAIVIPVKPLRHHSRYTATVKVQDRSGTLTHHWSFATG
jgi:Carboxypeptidase regulatory-like domain